MSMIKAEHSLSGGNILQIYHGDLTEESTDAIVNAANQPLIHGGGVAGHILKKGGEEIQEQSDSWTEKHGIVPTGQVAVTGAGRLGCKYIIHAVGPIWKDGHHDEPKLLESAVWNSLMTAHELQLTSISLPAISSGIFGFPKQLCAKVLITTAMLFFYKYSDSSLKHIKIINFDEGTAGIFQEELKKATK